MLIVLFLDVLKPWDGADREETFTQLFLEQPALQRFSSPGKDVIDVCSTVERTLNEGYLMSPNYPYNYPVNQDCLCKIYTDWSSRVKLSLYDLLLETKNGRCRADWVMLRQEVRNSGNGTNRDDGEQPKSVSK